MFKHINDHLEGLSFSDLANPKGNLYKKSTNHPTMDIWQIGIALFCGAAIAQSIFLAIYLFANDRLRSLPTLFLGIMLLAFALRIGKSYFFYVLPHVPAWGAALGAAGLWAIGPSLWLYTKASKPKPVRNLDLLHYLPAIALLCSSTFSIHWIVEAYHIGSIVLVAYVIGSAWLFWKGEWAGNPRRFKLFWGSIALMTLIFLLQMWGSIEWYTIGSAFACLVLYAINFIILQDQKVLKGSAAPVKAEDRASLHPTAIQLEQLFNTEKIYRQKGLTVALVADALDSPAYLVSKTINHYHQLKFNDFVNQYRIREVKAMLEDLTANHTIEYIATAVGFSSTSSLYHAFKKSTQLTPQAYRKKFSESARIVND